MYLALNFHKPQSFFMTPNACHTSPHCSFSHCASPATRRGWNTFLVKGHLGSKNNIWHQLITCLFFSFYASFLMWLFPSCFIYKIWRFEKCILETGVRQGCHCIPNNNNVNFWPLITLRLYIHFLFFLRSCSCFSLYVIINTIAKLSRPPPST